MRLAASTAAWVADRRPIAVDDGHPVRLAPPESLSIPASYPRWESLRLAAALACRTGCQYLGIKRDRGHHRLNPKIHNGANKR